MSTPDPRCALEVTRNVGKWPRSVWRRELPEDEWNDDSGDWGGLNHPSERPRYQAIARMIDTFCPRPVSVLDVGCGGAILRDYLSPSDSYFGIEPSRKAASIAMARVGTESVFCGTAAEFDGAGRNWSAVVFNEMLYYTADPVATIYHFHNLVPRGIRIVSIFQKSESLQQKVLSLLGQRVISNLSCTKLVFDLAAEHCWTVEADELVNRRWRIVTCRS